MVKFKKISVLIAAAVLGGGILNGCNGAASNSSSITPNVPLPSPVLKVSNVNSTVIDGLVYLNPNDNSTQVLITNSGSTNANNISFSFDSDSPISSQLSVSNNQCNGALAPSSACQISITLSNFSQSDINKSASLSIQFTDDNGKKFIQHVIVTVLNPDGVTTSFINRETSDIYNNLINGSAYGVFISTNLSQNSALISKKISGEGFTVIDNPDYYSSLPNECNPAIPLSQNQSCSFIIKNTLTLPLANDTVSGKLEIDANIEEQISQQSIFDIIATKKFEGIFGYNGYTNSNKPQIYDSFDGETWYLDTQTYPNTDNIPNSAVTQGSNSYSTSRFIQNSGGSLFLQEYQSDPTKVFLEENNTGFISEYHGTNPSGAVVANSSNLYSNDNGQVTFSNLGISSVSNFSTLYSLSPQYLNNFFTVTNNNLFFSSSDFSSSDNVYKEALTSNGNDASSILNIDLTRGNCSISNFYGSTLNNNLFILSKNGSNQNCTIYDSNGNLVDTTPNSMPVLKYDENNNKLEQIANFVRSGSRSVQISSFSDHFSNTLYIIATNETGDPLIFNYGNSLSNSLSISSLTAALISYNVSSDSWNIISNDIQLPGLNYAIAFAAGLGVKTNLTVNRE